MSLLLKDALIADPKSPYNNEKKDIFIKQGRISSLEGGEAEVVVDLKGKVLNLLYWMQMWNGYWIRIRILQSRRIRLFGGRS